MAGRPTRPAPSTRERDDDGVDRATVDVYERTAAQWRASRQRPRPPQLRSFVERVPAGPRADLGCGPGWHCAHLGRPVVALDAAMAMLAQVPEFAPHALRVQADLEHLPLRTGSLTGAWTHKSLMHVPRERIPMALAEIHRVLAPGAALHLRVTCDQLHDEWDDPFAGRHFTYYSTPEFRDVVESAGFEVIEASDDGSEWIDVEATRARMLPDTVAPGMRLLIVGLNPSVFSADAGVGFARPGNRFWPAAIAAGVATRSHDPYHLLHVDRVGMTNLVRRATARADELDAHEYRDGYARLERLVRRFPPRALCFVGVTGYRVAIDRRAGYGWQPARVAGVPAYVMPNTSGLNAHAKPADFAAHLRAALEPPT